MSDRTEFSCYEKPPAYSVMPEEFLLDSRTTPSDWKATKIAIAVSLMGVATILHLSAHIANLSFLSPFSFTAMPVAILGGIYSATLLSQQSKAPSPSSQKTILHAASPSNVLSKEQIKTEIVQSIKNHQLDEAISLLENNSNWNDLSFMDLWDIIDVLFYYVIDYNNPEENAHAAYILKKISIEHPKSDQILLHLLLINCAYSGNSYIFQELINHHPQGRSLDAESLYTIIVEANSCGLRQRTINDQDCIGKTQIVKLCLEHKNWKDLSPRYLSIFISIMGTNGFVSSLLKKEALAKVPKHPSWKQISADILQDRITSNINDEAFELLLSHPNYINLTAKHLKSIAISLIRVNPIYNRDEKLYETSIQRFTRISKHPNWNNFQPDDLIDIARSCFNCYPCAKICSEHHNWNNITPEALVWIFDPRRNDYIEGLEIAVLDLFSTHPSWNKIQDMGRIMDWLDNAFGHALYHLEISQYFIQKIFQLPLAKKFTNDNLKHMEKCMEFYKAHSQYQEFYAVIMSLLTSHPNWKN